MKILMTGFSPFGGEKINPSWEAIKNIRYFENIEIIKSEIPTEFFKATEISKELLKKYTPDILLHVGQAGGRNIITFEKIGINLRDSKSPDNSGYIANYEKISEDGLDGYFSTLNIEKIVNLLNKKNIPAKISLSAGSYVCNEVLYSSLKYIKDNNLNTKCSFIHVPFVQSQVIDKDMPFMELSSITKTLETTIELIYNYQTY